MTNTNTVTAETITTAQIKALREEAKMAGDDIQADMCEIALSGEDSDGTGTTLGKPLTVAQARAAIAEVIGHAQAQA